QCHQVWGRASAGGARKPAARSVWAEHRRAARTHDAAAKAMRWVTAILLNRWQRQAQFTDSAGWVWHTGGQGIRDERRPGVGSGRSSMTEDGKPTPSAVTGMALPSVQWLMFGVTSASAFPCGPPNDHCDDQRHPHPEHKVGNALCKPLDPLI